MPLVGVCFKTLDQAVLVMEKYDCQLGDYLRTNVKLNRWSVARQLVNIYRYLHYSLKVVHNDIKMDNLLVKCDSGRLGLVDFGLSGNLMKGDIFQEVSSGYRRSRTTGALVRWTPRQYWSNSKCQTCHQDKSVDLFAIAYVLLSVVCGMEGCPVVQKAKEQKIVDRHACIMFYGERYCDFIAIIHNIIERELELPNDIEGDRAFDRYLKALDSSIDKIYPTYDC